MKTNTHSTQALERSGDILAGFGGVVFRPRSDLAIWQQIYDHILGLIETGFLAPGSQLPGETHMAEKLGVTRITLRRALQQLQREGQLTARKGVGIFVRSLPSVFTVRDDRPFLENFNARGRVIVTQTLVLCREMVTTAIAKKLNLADGDEIIRLCRTRTADGQPLYVNTKIFPARPFPNFEMAYRKQQSVTDVFNAHGIGKYHRAETRVSGGFASSEEADFLMLTPGTPVFRINAINHDAGRRPIEWTLGCWPLTSVEFVF
ncbi:phosphonate metabolism transcriptional regulator PhnF [Rhizobium halophilum]|uniref:phosphonate metabolism transcriptional regulator PhnF n=1 Tax=Rhizobium halophilum TaxID=2846852 RepID=UPI001EFD4C4B|nr:phosphonate metabolism transcriptional regulator PhnF [Rhizobium halophilum]MCF6370855.1 phosphonate metabolism transcriptional regulator PhnF [Rhizobium halophilum]